eukprot:gene29366-55838_t
MATFERTTPASYHAAVSPAQSMPQSQLAQPLIASQPDYDHGQWSPARQHPSFGRGQPPGSYQSPTG